MAIKKEIKEVDGKLVAVPVGDPTETVPELDAVSWFEDDDTGQSEGWTSVIDFGGKHFWIKELSRKQNIKVDERLADISKAQRELTDAMQTAKNQSKSDVEKAEQGIVTLSPEAIDKLTAKLETLPDTISELNLENEEKVLLYSLKFWDVTGKRVAVEPEAVKKLYRSHKTELSNRILQKSRIGRSEGSF